MSETSNESRQNDVSEAWTKVGEAVNHATELYLKELTTYLDWAQDVQRELLEDTLSRMQRLSRLGEERIAFWTRIRDSYPIYGAGPKGAAASRPSPRAE